jgi:hypothetical protein
MLEIYKKKHEEANEYNQHADALRYEGAIMVIETLLIYAKEEEAEALLEEVKEEEELNDNVELKEDLKELDEWLMRGRLK